MPDTLPRSPAFVETSVLRLREGKNTPAPAADRIATEAPLEVRIGGRAAIVLMRTPGDDEELVRGFLFNEGHIHAAADVARFSRPAAPRGAGEEADNVIEVELAPSVPEPTLNRALYSSSACGACGKNSIAALAVRGEPSVSSLTVKRAVLASLPARLRAAQPAFQETGGVHASALFTADGTLIAVREDVGRHNALDKLIGWALAAGEVPLHDRVLLVSGRVSYELVQKAVAAAVPVIAAVGAPSSLAVDLAEQFRLTLVGFLRADSMNVYAGAERVVE